MADPSPGAGQYDDKTKADESQASFVKLWLDALNLATTEEAEWVKKAEETVEIYRGKKKTKGRSFNILHSNIETICPALYNSTPSPDVRRRFADPDPTGKVVADMIERALSFSIDSYDFDAVMKAVVRDGELVGRGIPRVRYIPTFAPGQAGAPGQPDDPADPAEAEGEGEAPGQAAPAPAQAAEPAEPPPDELVAEDVIADYVPWKFFRRGASRTWKDLPWVAFGDLLTKEELRKLCAGAVDKNGKQVAEEVPLNFSADTDSGKGGKTKPDKSIFRRALVWQIWDRESRNVISICPDYQDAPLATMPDPLGLKDFFPIPRAFQPVNATDSLTPIVPYEIYEDLVAELNDITTRITKLVRQLRPRALYAGDAKDITAWSTADDGELVPASNIEPFINNGGLEKALSWFPLEPIVAVLKILVEQRSEVKQIIFEVTGVADILRGSTQASETATAQQIKAQWGSLRIQDRQGDIMRVARDVFRLKAEIIASKFSWETLESMTGIKLPSNADREQARAQLKAMMAPPPPPMMPPQMPQGAAPQGGQPASPSPPQQPSGAPLAAQGPSVGGQGQLPKPDEGLVKIAEGPSREEAEQLMRSDVSRGYRIDIESDSTIRGDLTRNQQTMNLFLQGTALYAQAMAPLMQIDRSLMQPAIEVYTAFARQFKLGRQAEDALDSLADKARLITSQPPPPPPPNPKLDAIKVKSEADIKTTDMKMQAAEQKHGLEMEKLAAEGKAQTQELANDQERLKMDGQRAVLEAVTAPPPTAPAQAGA